MHHEYSVVDELYHSHGRPQPQARVGTCPSRDSVEKKVKMDIFKYVILCPNKLSLYRPVVTFHKRLFDFECENCRMKVKKIME